MKDLIKQRIEKGDFELIEILKKIDIMYIENKISIDEKRELEEKSREKARPEASYASPQAQIDALSEEVKLLREEVKALSDRLSDKTTIPDETPEETPTEIIYPEYVQPLGSHDAYQIGDRISYNGKNYECLISNCVWSPATYPAAWQEIVAEEVIPEPEVPEDIEIPKENSTLQE